MADEITRDQAVDELNNLITKLQAGDKKALIDTINAKMNTSEQENPTAENESHLIKYIGVILITLAISLAFSHYISISDPHIPLEQKILFSLIAFVVALASYLAATIREIIKNIGSAKADDRRSMKVNIFFIAIGETSLLIFGLTLLFRVFKGPFTISYFEIYSDIFILCYLTTILCGLILMHIRVWVITKPWILPKK